MFPQFYSLIQNDIALAGILLGYGTQNSLFGAHHESMEKAESFKPTFGFSNEAEERLWFKEQQRISLELSDEKLVPLPWFGFYETKETQKIIDDCKIARKKIVAVLNAKSFLEKLLSEIFSEKISLPNKAFKPYTFPDRKAMAKIVAKGIWHSFDRKDSSALSFYFKGMRDAESGNITLSEDDYRDLVVRYYHKNEENLLDQLNCHAGAKIWNHFKLGRDFYSYHDVMNILSKTIEEPISFEEDLILTRLHQWIYKMNYFTQR